MTEGPTSATSMWTSEPRQTLEAWPGSILDRRSASKRPGQLATNSVTALGRTRTIVSPSGLPTWSLMSLSLG